MYSFAPSLDSPVAAEHLAELLAPGISPACFVNDIRRLRRMFHGYRDSCPPPWPAPGLALTPEIHRQCRLWLPLPEIRAAYHRLYRVALAYAPVLSCSPFHNAASWAAVAAALPPWLHGCTDPSRLLERLLDDDELRTRFLCWSFMPRRFYGNGSDRYPEQRAYLGGWLTQRSRGKKLRFLDAACGDGAATYDLARLLLELGWRADNFQVSGWSLEPLEIWVAAHASFPHDPSRQAAFRDSVAPLFDEGAQHSLRFSAIDLEAGLSDREEFDLIICNGLLGGPLLHQPERMRRVAANLAALLRPEGVLLVADHFHDGWKKRVTSGMLSELLAGHGLQVDKAGEGICGLKIAA